MSLLQKIESRQATIAVIGLGYVGLPLARAFSDAGFRVVGIDIDAQRVERINRGEAHTVNGGSTWAHSIGHVSSSTPNKHNATGLYATTNYDTIREADAAIICVPTPLSRTKEPDMSYIIAATDEIARRLHPNMLVVLESTTYPGTTQEVVLPRLQAKATESGEQEIGKQGVQVGDNYNFPSADLSVTASKVSDPQSVAVYNPPSVVDSQRFKVGRDFFLAFSPERIDPGRTDYTIQNTPKVIGGVTSECATIAQALYACAIEQVVPVSSPQVAEMVKLLENTFRAVNIALINEVAIMCNRLKIDVWEVIEAAQTKPFGFMSFYPGPGLGGHCIPIDPRYLAWKLKTMNYNARFIQLAEEINMSMPRYVLDKIVDALNDVGKRLHGSQVLILGMAYKADVGDLRESPGLDLFHLLGERGAVVVYHDPYVPHLQVDSQRLDRISLDQGALHAADCVVIMTAHSSYNWGWIVENSRLVVDTRNATKGIPANSTQIVKI